MSSSGDKRKLNYDGINVPSKIQVTYLLIETC